MSNLEEIFKLFHNHEIWNVRNKFKIQIMVKFL
jgi:hypothetical protein